MTNDSAIEFKFALLILVAFDDVGFNTFSGIDTFPRQRCQTYKINTNEKQFGAYLTMCSTVLQLND